MAAVAGWRADLRPEPPAHHTSSAVCWYPARTNERLSESAQSHCCHRWGPPPCPFSFAPRAARDLLGPKERLRLGLWFERCDSRPEREAPLQQRPHQLLHTVTEQFGLITQEQDRVSRFTGRGPLPAPLPEIHRCCCQPAACRAQRADGAQLPPPSGVSPGVSRGAPPTLAHKLGGAKPPPQGGTMTDTHPPAQWRDLSTCGHHSQLRRAPPGMRPGGGGRRRRRRR